MLFPKRNGCGSLTFMGGSGRTAFLCLFRPKTSSRPGHERDARAIMIKLKSAA